MMTKKYPNFRGNSEPNSILPFLERPKKVILMIIVIGILPFIACKKNNEQKRSQTNLTKQYYNQSNFSASELEDFAIMAIENGNVSRAIDLWGQAATIYAAQGKGYDQARCLANRARGYAVLDRHTNALDEISQAKIIIELVGVKDRLYANIIGIFQREEKLLNMIAKYKALKNKSLKPRNNNSIRPQVLILAKQLLNDYGFRRSFLMDKAEPKSFPNQVKTALDLTDIELNALCLYGYKVHVKYHELLKQKYPFYMGASFELSPGFLAIMGNHLKGADTLVKQLEQKIGSVPKIDGE